MRKQIILNNDYLQTQWTQGRAAENNIKELKQSRSNRNVGEKSIWKWNFAFLQSVLVSSKSLRLQNAF